jgi:hypothetical protein
MVDAPQTRRITHFPSAILGPTGVIASPFQFLVTGDDHLEVTSFNSLTGCRVAVHHRFLEEGRVTPQATSFTHTPNTDRTANTTRHALGQGALLNLRVVADSGGPLLGQTFVIVRVIRGQEANAVALGTLIQGYVTASQDQAWPGSPLVNSLSGVVPRLITGTDPAAGSQVSETVPTGARWKLLMFNVQLAASATASNRRPSLTIRGAGNKPLFRFPLAKTWAANETKQAFWSVGTPLDTSITTDAGLGGLPHDTVLTGGMEILTDTEGMQAGDDYGAPNYYVEETLEVG